MYTAQHLVIGPAYISFANHMILQRNNEIKEMKIVLVEWNLWDYELIVWSSQVNNTFVGCFTNNVKNLTTFCLLCPQIDITPKRMTYGMA